MNRDQFDDLVRRHWNRWLHVAQKLLSEVHDAENAVQEALTRVWNRCREGAQIENPEAYITQAVRNAARDVLRRRVNMPMEPRPDDDPEDEHAGAPHDEVDAHDEFQWLRDQLSPNDRHYLDCFLLDDHDAREQLGFGHTPRAKARFRTFKSRKLRALREAVTRTRVERV